MSKFRGGFRVCVCVWRGTSLFLDKVTIAVWGEGFIEPILELSKRASESLKKV